MSVRVLASGDARTRQRITAALPVLFPGEEPRWCSARELLDGPGAVVLPWAGTPHGLPPVAAAARALRAGRPVTWIDDRGHSGRARWAFVVLQGARVLLHRALRGLLETLLRLPRPVDLPPADPDDGALVVVLPVLPDLSHTFVYREVLELLDQTEGPVRIVVLERGDPQIEHPEARRLLPHAGFLPKTGGVLRAFVPAYRWLLRAPRRAAALAGLYRGEGGDAGGLFGKPMLTEARHPSRAFALAEMLRGQPVRHLHVYGSTYAANVTMGAALLLGRPWSLSSYVDFDFDYAFRMLRTKYERARFFRVCTRYCQERMLEHVAEAVAERLPVLVWGLDLASWQDPAQPPHPNGQLLFSACRLVPKKGLHRMPAALAALARQGIECRWLIAGDGPERARLEALVAEHGLEDQVDFLGPLPNDAVRETLARTDLAVLPCVQVGDGERDGIPVFLTEAMALGVPVLSSPISGIPELIRDRENGYLAAPDDDDALARVLTDALRDPAERARRAAAGRRDVLATQDAAASALGILQRVEGPGGPP